MLTNTNTDVAWLAIGAGFVVITNGGELGSGLLEITPLVGIGRGFAQVVEVA